MESRRKSTITCDMEGVITTFNVGAEDMFGYSTTEAIGRMRVSNFSPGEVVLQNLGGWLATAVKEGEWIGETNFIRKNGEMFGARIRISPTFKDGQQIGFCGVTEELDAVVDVPIKGSTKAIRWLVITRAPFLTAALTPVAVGLAWVASVLGAPIPWAVSIAAGVGVALLHLASNVLNDYFDVSSGTDQANTKYFQQFSGGSRSIEMRLIDLAGTKRVGLALAGIAFMIGLILTAVVGTGVLYIGLAGLAIGYFYTAPPIRLVARRGLGELGIALAFGPLITLGMAYVATGDYHLGAFLAGLPAGLFTANILLINQFPDAESDAMTGKNHLVVTFGHKASIAIYAVIHLAALATTSYLAMLWQQPLLHIVSGVGLVYGAWIINHMRLHYNDRQLVKANVQTINMQILLTVLMTILMAIH